MKYLFIILMLISGSANADWATYGVGKDTCKTFSQKYDAGGKSSYIDFTAGYMTVLNEIQEKKKAVDVEPDVMVLYVRRVCRTPKRKNQVFVTVLSLTIESIAKTQNPDLLALYAE